MQIANLFARLGLKVDKGQFDQGLAKINATRLALVAAGTYITAKFAGAFITGTKEVFDMGDALGDLSTRTGQSTEFLQKLAFAAGGGMEGLGKAQGALDKFGVRLREAVENPTNDTAKALKALGLSVDDPRVRLGNLEAIMQEVADKFETMPNGAEKNAIAFGLMSKSGLEMSQVLTEFNEKARVANEAGLIMDDDQIARANKGKDALEAFGAQWQGIKQRAVVEAMPAILKAFDVVRAWVKENGPVIRKALSAVLEAVADKIKFMIAIVKDNAPFFKAAFQVISAAIAAIGVAINVVIAAAGALMKTFEVVGTAIGESVGWIVTQFQSLAEWASKTAAMIAAPFKAAWAAVEEQFDRVFGKIEALYKKVKGWVDDMAEAADFIAGGESDRQASMRKQISARDRKSAAALAQRLMAKGATAREATAKVESVYGKATSTLAMRDVAKQVTVNAAPITVTINGANETPENLGIMFQKKIQEAQNVMLRDAAATIGGAI